MIDKLLTFTTDNLGRIRLDMDPSPVGHGVIDECCCRNAGQPFQIGDGWYTSTDPGCKFHGLKAYKPTAAGLVQEAIEEMRCVQEARAQVAEIRKNHGKEVKRRKQ
jgi:hypothetical protein